MKTEIPTAAARRMRRDAKTATAVNTPAPSAAQGNKLVRPHG